MLQTIIVTVVAAGALGLIVRRYSSSWLPTAFRPERKQEACQSCPLMTDSVPTGRTTPTASSRH